MSQLDRLGLLENPFNNNLEPRYFYADQSRDEILESSEQLIDNSNDFQVIVGDSGMGKSHFLGVLAEQIDDKFRVVKIIDGSHYDTDNLLQGLLDVLGTKDLEDDVDQLEVLKIQLSEINAFGFKPILFVDNAQTLSLESLTFLIQLSQERQDQQSYINIILFSTAEITELLQDQAFKNYRDIIHLATLVPFKHKDLADYLNHKMLTSGFKNELIFTDRIVDSIFTDSKGVPKDIDFYANKFLVSSGKADNYIKSYKHNRKTEFIKPVHNITESSKDIIEPVDDFEQLKEDKFLSALDEKIEHPSDRAEEQLNRLNEEFDEIEQIDHKSNEKFVKENVEEDDLQQIFDDNSEISESTLPKFVIPMALIGLLAVIAIVISSMFKGSGQDDTDFVIEEEGKIEDLVLELPPQGSINNDTNTNTDAASTEGNSDTLIDLIGESDNETIDVELIEDTPVDNKEHIDENISYETIPTPKAIPETISSLIPELKSVKPKLVIGSEHRQYISIQGDNLTKQTRIFVRWSSGEKEFSQEKTPRQWQYINKNEIKLHLSTGTKVQEWQVIAKNSDDEQSQVSQFKVVKPYTAKLSIEEILPSVFIGSNKRETLTIKGKGFSEKTAIELRWDKNKKIFSSQLTANQFKYINSNQIDLSIATGTEPKKWMVTAISSNSNDTSRASFTVIKEPSTQTKELQTKNPQTKSIQNNMIKGENWLKQQADNNYTIQLIGSHNKGAIDQAIKEYTLMGDVLIYKTLRDGQDWYTITYGSYTSKQLAEIAVKSLDTQMIKTPWVRSFASIKNQLSSKAIPNSDTQADTQSVSSETITADNNRVVVEDRTSIQNPSKTQTETWVRTQNSNNYTIQLIALSSEERILKYTQKYNLESKTVYFKAMRDGKLLYILISGSYDDRRSAQQAGEQLFQTIQEGKPWIRKFSTLQEMITQ